MGVAGGFDGDPLAAALAHGVAGDEDAADFAGAGDARLQRNLGFLEAVEQRNAILGEPVQPGAHDGGIAQIALDDVVGSPGQARQPGVIGNQADTARGEAFARFGQQWIAVASREPAQRVDAPVAGQGGDEGQVEPGRQARAVVLVEQCPRDFRIAAQAAFTQFRPRSRQIGQPGDVVVTTGHDQVWLGLGQHLIETSREGGRIGAQPGRQPDRVEIEQRRLVGEAVGGQQAQAGAPPVKRAKQVLADQAGAGEQEDAANRHAEIPYFEANTGSRSRSSARRALR